MCGRRRAADPLLSGLSYVCTLPSILRRIRTAPKLSLPFSPMFITTACPHSGPPHTSKPSRTQPQLVARANRPSSFLYGCSPPSLYGPAPCSYAIEPGVYPAVITLFSRQSLCSIVIRSLRSDTPYSNICNSIRPHQEASEHHLNRGRHTPGKRRRSPAPKVQHECEHGGAKRPRVMNRG